MHTYEVEIKALLGSPERARELRERMKQRDPSCVLTGKNAQLNHYFEGGTLERLAEEVGPHLPPTAIARLNDMAARATQFSVRTREKDGTVLLVVKASVDDTTSENGIARMEFEEQVPLPLGALDALVIASGFTYQAKWSREREEYLCKGVAVCLDKNAGYGYLAEFERVVDSPDALDEVRGAIRALMGELSVEELPQDRLERMFAHYNAHWRDYYGTDRIFVVE